MVRADFYHYQDDAMDYLLVENRGLIDFVGIGHLWK